MGAEGATQPERRQMLVVAGTGRSGTSLFTGLTGRLGLLVPKPEVSPNRSNPRGFSEPRWLVDYHNDLLASINVVIEDGRPEAWDLTDEVAADPEALGPLVGWLDQQFTENPRIVVKDPRLAWFIRLHRVAAAKVGADVHVVTMLRHPAEVMRSREIAYGTRNNNTTRIIGWLTMMLGIETRTRDLPRAIVRFDDLLDDWRAAMAQVDEGTGMRLLGSATEDQLADAGALVDPGLHRSTGDWAELGIPARVLDLARRGYDAYGRLVGVPPVEQDEARAELDALRAELGEYYDECFDVARNRTGAFARSEKRKVARRVRQELQEAAAQRRPGLAARLRTAGARLRRGSR